MKVRYIPRKRDLHKKRVAAYCRVSTTLDNQEDSFETQKRYYESYIKRNEEWEFAGIYCDEKSAAKAKNRLGFQQMIRDALDGKIDFILNKSISRFSRNVVDCQNYTKLLHGNGVDLYFEKEGIHTADSSGSLMFSLLSAIAQNESQSISENVRWGYRERFKRGEYNLGNNRILGYDCVAGRLIANEEAWMIRLIFRQFLKNQNYRQAAEFINAAGGSGLRKKPMSESGVRYILSNETYVGDRLLQKKGRKEVLKEDPKTVWTKHPEEKRDLCICYYLKNDHEPIIERDIWNQVQGILNMRKEERKTGINRRGKNSHFLYGRIFCGECGAVYTRRTCREYKKDSAAKTETYKSWTCVERHKGKAGNGCKNTNIRETVLLKEIGRQLGWEWKGIEKFSINEFYDIVRRVEVKRDESRGNAAIKIYPKKCLNL